MTVKAQHASDAIQTALMKYPGHTVKACALRDTSGNGMNFDVPKHRALTVEDVERMTPERKEPKPRREHCSSAGKPAPWIQEWMDRKIRACNPARDN